MQKKCFEPLWFASNSMRLGFLWCIVLHSTSKPLERNQQKCEGNRDDKKLKREVIGR
jgi:hypothetical protein